MTINRLNAMGRRYAVLISIALGAAFVLAALLPQ